MEQRLSSDPFISTRPYLIGGLRIDTEAPSWGQSQAGWRFFFFFFKLHVLFSHREGVILLYISVLEFKKAHTSMHVHACRGESERG